MTARGADAAPTPCRDWDLRALLAHLDESLLALHEAAHGHVPLTVAAEPDRPTRWRCVRDRASCRLLGAWTNTARAAGHGSATPP